MDTSLQRLRQWAEQLQLARTLIDKDSPIFATGAMILLHGQADAIMYRKLKGEFDRDEELIAIQKPRFSIEERDEAKRDFKKKVSVLEKLKFVSAHDAVVLRIAHSYRNAAYHRDTHNANFAPVLSRFLLAAATRLFSSYYNNGVHMGAAPEWVEKYGIDSGKGVSHAAVANAVAAFVTSGLPSLVQSRDVLAMDVASRLEGIRHSIGKMAISKRPKLFDEGLKMAEFSDAFPSEHWNHEIHALHYRIVSKDGKSVSAQEYRKAERSAKRKREAAFASFTPICSMKALDALEHSKSLQKSQSIPALLNAYQRMDGTLSRFEESLEALTVAFDRAAQYFDDLRRGK